MATAPALRLTQFYAAVLDRVPDTPGMRYWLDRMSEGMSAQQVAVGFFRSPEAQPHYPPNLTNEAFVRLLYETMFDRTVDQAGQAYWVGLLEDLGGSQVPDARAGLLLTLLDLIDDPLTVRLNGWSDDMFATAQRDRVIFANKLEVGMHYGTVRETSMAQTEGVMQIVDETPESVIEAIRGLQPEVPEPPTPEPPTPQPPVVVPPIVVPPVLGNEYTLAQIDALRGVGGAPDGVLVGTPNDEPLYLSQFTRSSSALVTRNIDTIFLSEVTDGVVIDVVASFENMERISVGASESNGSVPALLTLVGMEGKELALHGDPDVPIPADTVIDTWVMANIGATQDSFTVEANHANAWLSLQGDALKTLNLVGNGRVSLPSNQTLHPPITDVNLQAVDGLLDVALDSVPNLERISAAGSTGEIEVTLHGAVDYEGSDGKDTLIIRRGTGGTVNGGAGDEDVLAVGLTATSFNSLNHSGFEVLRLLAGAGGVYDGSGFKTLQISENIGPTRFANIAADTELLIDANVTGSINYELAETSSPNDIVSVVLGGAVKVEALLVALQTEEVHLESQAPTGTSAEVLLSGSDINNVVVTGSGSLKLVTASNSRINSVDASGMGNGAGLDYTSNQLGTSVAMEVIGARNGVNTLVAGAADHTLIAGDMGDTLRGGAGDDMLRGGAGNDTLTAGAGLDTLTGGAGNDVFRFGVNADRNTYATVTDFARGDTLDLQGLLVGKPDLTEGGLQFLQMGPAISFAQKLQQMKDGAADSADYASVTLTHHDGDTWILISNADLAASFVDGEDQLLRLEGLYDDDMLELVGGVITFQQIPLV